VTTCSRPSRPLVLTVASMTSRSSFRGRRGTASCALVPGRVCDDERRWRPGGRRGGAGGPPCGVVVATCAVSGDEGRRIAFDMAKGRCHRPGRAGRPLGEDRRIGRACRSSSSGAKFRPRRRPATVGEEAWMSAGLSSTGLTRPARCLVDEIVERRLQRSLPCFLLRDRVKGRVVASPVASIDGPRSPRKEMRRPGDRRLGERPPTRCRRCSCRRAAGRPRRAVALVCMVPEKSAIERPASVGVQLLELERGPVIGVEAPQRRRRHTTPLSAEVSSAKPNAEHGSRPASRAPGRRHGRWPGRAARR